VHDPEQRALAFAGRLAARCSDALGDAVLAVILHGSLTLGDFTPGRSDIDLLVIVATPLSDDRVAALRDAVDQVREAAPSRVDLRVVTRATTRSPTLAPLLEASLTVRPGRGLEVETRIAEPDLIVEFAIARAHGSSIVGHAPADVIDAVVAECVLEVADRQLAAWQRLTDDADHAELMVLTACRIWCFAIEREFCSKAAAGRWALERQPSLRVVEQALRQRTGDRGATIAADGIGQLLGLVREQLRVQRGGTGP
jgi:predicted nucleotidyltransferase